MASTYLNDLRLNELGTGDAAGTWGTITNTNLELIGEGLSYATEDCFTSDADATATVADGASDPARAMYFKVTSSATLTTTRTLTIDPNTVSRLQYIENATTGGQSINISQGSGANVTIPNGATKVIYMDGAGVGAAVTDALALLNLTNLNVQNIVSSSNANININPDGTGNVLIGNYTFDADQTVGAGQDNYLMTYDDSTGLVSLEEPAAGGAGFFQGDNGNTGDTTNGKGDIFRTHEQELNTNTTIASSDNSGCFFSLSIATGVTLTVDGNLVIS